ncbi:MAG: hypothetical protein EOO43_25295, partial [Flavobacterium sp.]
MREIANFVKYLDSANVDSFKSYILSEIRDNLEESATPLFDILETINIDRFNQYIYTWYNRRPRELRRRRSSTERSYENYSFGDIFSSINIIESETLITNTEELKQLLYFKIYYSIKVATILNQNNELTQRFFLGGVNTEDDNIFPKEQGVFRRDWIRVSGFKALKEQINDEELLWIGFFVSYYGKIDNVNRDLSHYRFDKVNINSIDNLSFNPLAFIYNSFFPEKIASILQIEEEGELFRDIKIWRDENIHLLNIYFGNFQFTQLFFNLLNKWTAEYRDSSLGDYHSTLRIYLVSGINFVLGELQSQY